MSIKYSKNTDRSFDNQMSKELVKMLEICSNSLKLNIKVNTEFKTLHNNPHYL